MKISEIHPYLNIESINGLDFVITKNGEYSVGFLVNNPEIYTLSYEDFENLHKTFKLALNLLPENTLVQKQDWFIEDNINMGSSLGLDFIRKAQFLENNEKLIYKQLSFIYITMTNGEINYSNNILSRKGLVKSSHLERKEIEFFIQSVNRFITSLEESKYFKFKNLKKNNFISKNGITNMYFSLDMKPTLHEINFKDTGEINIGNKRASIYSIVSENDFGDEVETAMLNPIMSTDDTKMYQSFTNSICGDLECNHIYNQYYFIENQDKHIARFELEKSRLISLGGKNENSSNSKNIAKFNDVSNFLKKVTEEGLKFVKCHFNLIVWENDNENNKLDEKIISAFNKMEIKVYRHGKHSAPSLWYASIPCNGGDLPNEERLLLTMNEALCMLCIEGDYISNKQGIIVFDRKNTVPMVLDLFDEPYKTGQISNRNGILIGPPGASKSVTVNYFVVQEVHNNFDVVIIDIGNSYKKTFMYFRELGVKCTYLTNDDNKPLAFNPFLINNKTTNITKEEFITKSEFLISVLFLLWKKDPEDYTNEEETILKSILESYYEHINNSRGEVYPCFDTFYSFIQDSHNKAIATNSEKLFGTKISHFTVDSYFDLDSYYLVNKRFLTGNEFGYLLNSKEKIDLLNDKLVVFELDKIKEHKLLYPLVTTMVIETILDKMRNRKEYKKRIYMDEAWDALSKAGMKKFIEYLYRTIRKFDGSIYMITQSIYDITDPFIIGSSDIKIFLSHENAQSAKEGFKKNIGLTENEIASLYSIKNNFKSMYSEVFIKVGNKAKIYRIKLTKEELALFTSVAMDNIKIYKDIEESNVQTAIRNAAEKM